MVDAIPTPDSAALSKVPACLPAHHITGAALVSPSLQVYEEEVLQKKQVLYRGFGTQKPGGMRANMFDIRDKVCPPAASHRGGKPRRGR